MFFGNPNEAVTLDQLNGFLPALLIAAIYICVNSPPLWLYKFLVSILFKKLNNHVLLATPNLLFKLFG